YVVEISEDGEHYDPLWRAEPVARGGVQSRWTRDLDASGRFIRISPDGGDGSYSIAEVQIFSQAPATLPPRVETQDGYFGDEWMRSSILIFALALFAFGVGAHPRHRALSVILAALTCAAAWQAVAAVVEGWPVTGRTVA